MLSPTRLISFATVAAATLLSAGTWAASSADTPTPAADSAAANRAPEGQHLVGSQEVPPVDTAASAVSTIAIGADKSVTGGVETTGIDGTAAHIHQGAPGENGPPLITLAKTSATKWSVPAGAALNDAQYAAYKAGNLYVNVHSVAHSGGEIRLQLKP